jgi:O-antigen ligase
MASRVDRHGRGSGAEDVARRKREASEDRDRLGEAIAPIYLLLCLLLGGSAQGAWTNLLLRLAGIVIIMWAAAAPRRPLGRMGRSLFAWILLALFIAALQLIPLPPSLWTHLPGREFILEGYRLIGGPLPWMPLSVTPYDSAAALLAIIPALASLAAVLRLGCRPAWLVIALMAGTIGGIVLGVLQVGSTDPETSRWYLYPQSSWGLATGFFANANHMATLLLITIPFLAALPVAVRRRSEQAQLHSGIAALAASGLLLVLIGITLNGSLAAYGLLLPVLAASALIIVPRTSRARRWLAIAAALLLVASVALLWTNGGRLGSRLGLAGSVHSREQIYATTMRATRDFMPLGSGLGSFPRVYAVYEDHARLDVSEYVNHAHNDYLEYVLELGLAGVVGVALFLMWWGRAVWSVWRGGSADAFARAASIASAAVLVHSIVDFPLRTAAISAAFAMCLGLLAVRRRVPSEPSQLWQTRHLVVGG